MVMKHPAKYHYEYLWCSMMGSFWVDCEVVKKDGDRVTLTYYDDILREQNTAETTKDRLRRRKDD